LKWSDLELPWQAALEEAWLAACAGCVPIGAVITDAGGVIVARGRNHIRDQDILPGQVCHSQLAHAELNALLTLSKPSGDIHAYSIYSTMDPCPLCMGAIYMSGVRTLHFACRDAYAGSANMLGTTPYLSLKPVRAFGPARPDLETILIAVQTEEILSGYNHRIFSVLEEWQKICPGGVSLGNRLYTNGELQAMRTCRITTAEMIDRLSFMIN
jgi:tRNA(adenine34) deaminase